MEKAGNIQEQMGNQNRNSKKESKRNDRNQKHSSTNEECFAGLNCRLDMTKERINNLENMPVETSKIEMQREKKKEKRKKKPRTEHLRTARHFQRYNIHTIGIKVPKKAEHFQRCIIHTIQPYGREDRGMISTGCWIK